MGATILLHILSVRSCVTLPATNLSTQGGDRLANEAWNLACLTWCSHTRIERFDPYLVIDTNDNGFIKRCVCQKEWESEAGTRDFSSHGVQICMVNALCKSCDIHRLSAHTTQHNWMRINHDGYSEKSWMLIRLFVVFIHSGLNMWLRGKCEGGLVGFQSKLNTDWVWV